MSDRIEELEREVLNWKRLVFCMVGLSRGESETVIHRHELEDFDAMDAVLSVHTDSMTGDLHIRATYEAKK